MAYYDGTYSDSEDDFVSYILITDEDDKYYSGDNNDSRSDIGDVNFDVCNVTVTQGSDVSNTFDDEDNQNVIDDSLTDDSEAEMWSGTPLNPKLPNYDGKLRPSDNISLHFPKSPSPIDVFRLFFTPDITGYIVDQSNLYRMQNKLLHQYPMTEDDFYCLIGFLYYSSVVPLPSKSDYWSNYCRQAEKIEPLIRLFNEVCLTTVQSETNISIDEQMVGYRGKQHQKPTKRGFIFWTRCGVTGFVYEIKLYRGSKEICSNKTPSMQLQRLLRSTTAVYDEEKRIEDENNENLRQFGSSGMIISNFLEHIPLGSRV
ncbi:unnamed protein product [Rotaria socialis]|uniref:PiggyBac transposable element-derived protein domain-containing protein n=1 Tax=Rotaria socialis TaxID=392032 RepID=A0A817ZIU0_9BILA|nr:unnamed protein product [Rotaria socialis]CAF4616381.1 unnamed protein product [Rotaria socialis]